MATKQLRTVKKSSETGRLNRDAVRSAVISVRDDHSGPDKSGVGKARKGKNQHAGRVLADCTAGD
jgi:hypothetical protein